MSGANYPKKGFVTTQRPDVSRTASVTGSWKLRNTLFSFRHLTTAIPIFIIYYIILKNSENIQPDFIGGMLGCVAPLTFKSQKDVFSEIIEETLGEQCNFETVKNLHENLTAYVDEHKDEPDPVAFDKSDVRRALEQSGVESEHIRNFHVIIMMMLRQQNQALWHPM